jgi:hypothetical protein
LDKNYARFLTLSSCPADIQSFKPVAVIVQLLITSFLW